MPIRSSYAHGTPSWIDLSTTDTNAARAFYGALFDWTFESFPTDADGGEYLMARLPAGAVAGMMSQPAEQAAMGVPPMWNSYVTVDDLDATVAKVQAAGGSVMAAPFDVMSAGRMAVVVDPSGAVLCLWKPIDHIGAEVVNEPGSLVWNELISTDLDASVAFFAEVLGWGAEPFDAGGGAAYQIFMVDGVGVAGAMSPPMEGMPSAWGIYFAVEDCDATVARAGELGATVLTPPMDIPVGRMAALRDPTGAVFSVITTSPTDGS